MKKKIDLKRIDKIWTTGKSMQSFNTCIKSSSHTWVYFSYIYFECHQSHLSSKKFNLFFAIYKNGSFIQTHKNHNTAQKQY